MTTEYSRARIDKDRNYDGKFFFAVTTTGIFCRPSCPSPVAKEKNVRYFDTMFEAMDEGFRPCLRCRPDVEVEYYNGNVSGSATVDAALDMIYDGYLNYHSLSELAETLGVSDRHLRTLFTDNLGVPPVKIARYHKALFAKKLLLASEQSVTDIAFASGFGSIRQFNEAFKDIFGRTPSQLRKEQAVPGGKTVDTTLFLKYRTPFDFGHILSFIRPRAIMGVERVGDDFYSRTFRTTRTRGHFTVRDNPARSALELSIVCDDIKCFMEVHNRVRRMFDLDTDFAVINALFSKDSLLKRGMIDGHSPRLPVAFDPFEAVVRAILGQQISVKAATTYAGRLADAAGVASDETFPEGLDHFFPNPAEVLSMDLDGLGLTQSRRATLSTAAQAVADKAVALTANQPFEAFRKSFLALKGIGDWTVNYVAMRGLGIRDAFPAGDLGVLKALAVDGEKPSQKEAIARAERWRPYRAYATLCLWNTLSEDD